MIIERKLAQISPLVLMLVSHFGVMLLAFCIIMLRHIFGAHFIQPQGNELWFLGVWVVLSFFSGFFFYSAYHRGASLMMMTTIVMLFPVFAALMKIAVGDGIPSFRQIAAWIFAAIAVLLVSRQ